MRSWRSVFVLIAVCLLPLSLSGANFVFVFHGSIPTISMYNADTLELVATQIGRAHV